MCYVASCPKANVISGGYFVKGACQQHLKEVEKTLRFDYQALAKDDTLLHNATLAYIFMSDEEAVMARLRSFSTILNTISGGKPPRLTAGLEYYELLCWFPRVRVMPTGLLSSAEFLDLIARGIVLKDIGAGPSHGRLTHRLQWHALAAAMTDKFAKPMAAPFTMTPLQLYCAFGRPGTVSKSGSALWGAVFDKAGSNPEHHFRAPDRLNAAVLADTSLCYQVNLAKKTSADARNLARAVSHHLNEAAGGTGPFAGTLSAVEAPNVKAEFLKGFGPAVAFDFYDLLKFLDVEIFKGGTVGKFNAAYVYTVTGAGNAAAVQAYLLNRSLPTNMKLMAKVNAVYSNPTADDAKVRMASSVSGFNTAEVGGIVWDFVK